MPQSVHQSVLYMKVTEALRAPGPSNIAELAKTYNIAEFPNLLPLAVDLSPLETVKWVTKLYETKHRNFNEVDPQTGNTALHIAVASNRPAIVRHLMDILDVDDTIRNRDGITAIELASDPEMEAVLSHAETKFAERTAVRLKHAFKNRDIHELEHIYANPRVSELLNINGLDPDTHLTVLHDSAQANDIQLVKFILAHGGDPMVRDPVNHKLPQDLTSSDEIRVLLNNSAKSKAILDQTHHDEKSGAATGAPAKAQPSMEGYLKKWTNITSGYKLRWFKLANGELSYFKRPEDAKQGDRLIRGSIGLRHASVRLDSSEKNKFAIRTPSTKFHLKATHPAETNKWVWALQSAITTVRDREKGKQVKHPGAGATAGATGATAGATGAMPGAATGAAGTGAAGTTSGAAGTTGTTAGTTEGASPISVSHAGSHDAQNGQGASGPNATSTHSNASNGSDEPQSPSAGSQHPFPQLHSPPSHTFSAESRHSHKDSVNSTGDGWIVNDIQRTDNFESDDDEEDEDDLILQGPQISVESLIGRLSAIKDLMGMLVFQIQDEAMRDAITTTQGSIDVVSSDIVMLHRQGQAHLRKAKAELDQSENNQRMWANNYRDLEIHSEKLEGRIHELKAQVGHDSDDDDEFFDTMDNAPIQRARAQKNSEPQATKQQTENPQAVAQTGSETGPHTGAHPDSQTQPQHPQQKNAEENTYSRHPPIGNSGASEVPNVTGNSGAAAGAAGAAGAGAVGAGAAGADASEADTGDASTPSVSHSNQNSKNQPDTGSAPEKAPENGPESSESMEQPPLEAPPVPDYARPENAPGDDISQYGTHPQPEKLDPAALTPPQKDTQQKIVQQKTFAGYQDGPRQKLKINADNRPRLSLWGILKNLIGKDMTKMTLPVTFNECTSLLQRSAEDMEYTELLDKAAQAVSDPGLRMVYVAAFAGSSYSSTIDRVAKPFNPLLGETYEYARPDKGYRLFAEQVSHHPPIGALIAESKHWDFYGESNVESKFYGRSFDINPLGLWYLNLRPDKGAGVDNELYSFRKITSSVVGIMLGNPVVDNYGDMEITNHTLGIKAVINYKARGWRGSSAYKLQGKVTDKHGKELWTIGGQWNSKMYGMKSGDDTKILLWEAHERHRTPFNLTDFAITLNALPDNLRPWLPPTDTRLRPDQRAMEEGRYDDASDEKNRVEEKQRAARREREARGEKYKPQWFELVPHPVTGKNYYRPINDYWAQRGQGALTDKPHIF